MLRELEKIKRERAAEKERQEREAQQSAQADRDQEIATANPRLNLAAALGTPQGVNTNQKGTFAVKKRWDDDHIFKNQAMNEKDKSQNGFVNDLLRTEFHKYVCGLHIYACGTDFNAQEVHVALRQVTSLSLQSIYRCRSVLYCHLLLQ